MNYPELYQQLYFDLPEDRIAKFPHTSRDGSKLMVLQRHRASQTHSQFSELRQWLRPGDLLVLNNSKVIPARLKAHTLSGLPIEVFLLAASPQCPTRWECLVRPMKRFKSDALVVQIGGLELSLERCGPRCTLSFPAQWTAEQIHTWLAENGQVPLPPYFKREALPEDKERYQTVYATEPGSVAAPTAGLHFTPQLLNELQQSGVGVAEVTLHVGYGTFAPLRDEQIASGTLHPETYFVPEATSKHLATTRARGGRVIAVGTTSLRTLESAAKLGPQGNTTLFIQPGYTFTQVDGLLTNFHLPDSSLLLLVAAFLGTNETREAYQQALCSDYRFYSYGDAMLILP